MVGRFHAALVGVALGVVAGCYSPSIESDQLSCADSTGRCPTGFHCTFDNFCWKDGTEPVPSLPGAPSGLAADAILHGALLSWLPPRRRGGSPVTRYTVTASPGGATAASSGAEAQPFVSFGDLADGQTYSFTVTAENASGVGPPSEPSPPVETPAVPGSPTAVRATLHDSSSATITWTSPSGNGSAITSYYVAAIPLHSFATVAGSPTTLFLLRTGVEYRFTVTAFNAVGAGPASAPSEPLTP